MTHLCYDDGTADSISDAVACFLLAIGKAEADSNEMGGWLNALIDFDGNPNADAEREQLRMIIDAARTLELTRQTRAPDVSAYETYTDRFGRACVRDADFGDPNHPASARTYAVLTFSDNAQRNLDAAKAVANLLNYLKS